MSTSNERLKKAIEAGNGEANAEAKRKEEERTKACAIGQAKEAAELKEARELVQGDFLYTRVQNALAHGHKNFAIHSGVGQKSGPYPTRALAQAINEVAGFRAVFTDGNENINSDEVKEYWADIDVTWES